MTGYVPIRIRIRCTHLSKQSWCLDLHTRIDKWPARPIPVARHPGRGRNTVRQGSRATTSGIGTSRGNVVPVRLVSFDVVPICAVGGDDCDSSSKYNKLFQSAM